MKAVSAAPKRRARIAGFTVLELVLTCGILVVMSTAAMPVARFALVRNREYELRYDLRQMRDAIDRYKYFADRNLIQAEAGTGGYPPDLDALVKGVYLGSASRKIRFLRRIPVDPITGKADWSFRSVQDDSDSTGWGGQDVFDVRSNSQGTALDGTKYSDW